MERAVILCKLDKSLFESWPSVGIHRQKSLFTVYISNFVTVFLLELFIKPVGPIKCEKILRGVIFKIQPLKEPVNFQQYDLCTNFKSTPQRHVKSPTF